MELDEDEAFVETGEDHYHAVPPPTRAAPPQPTMLDYLLHYLSNPWVIIVITFIFYKFFYRRIHPIISDWLSDWRLRRQEAQETAEMVRNPDAYQRKMEAMDEVRKQQQERYEAAARVMAERERVKEEEKRRQKMEELENLVSGRGYRNKSDLRGQQSDQNGLADSGEKVKKKRTLRPEYNPLMGDSSSGACFRRPRGGAGAGGGG